MGLEKANVIHAPELCMRCVRPHLSREAVFV